MSIKISDVTQSFSKFDALLSEEAKALFSDILAVCSEGRDSIDLNKLEEEIAYRKKNAEAKGERWILPGMIPIIIIAAVILA